MSDDTRASAAIIDKARTAADVISAAQEWVESIGDHPNLWGDTPDLALIRAVRTHVPGVRCQWMEKPEYEGWTDSTAPDDGRSEP